MTPESLARFIAERSGELALLAGRARWPLLTYFLNMARIEAEARESQDTPLIVASPPLRNGHARS